MFAVAPGHRLALAKAVVASLPRLARLQVPVVPSPLEDLRSLFQQARLQFVPRASRAPETRGPSEPDRRGGSAQPYRLSKSCGVAFRVPD